MLNNIRRTSQKLKQCFSLLKSSNYYQSTSLSLFRFRQLNLKDASFSANSKVNHPDREVIQPESYWVRAQLDFEMRTVFTVPEL